MPIFNKHNNHLSDIYGKSYLKYFRIPIFIMLNIMFSIIYYLLGDYFLAELIEAQDKGNKCIVADVSVISVSSCYS